MDQESSGIELVCVYVCEGGVGIPVGCNNGGGGGMYLKVKRLL